MQSRLDSVLQSSCLRTSVLPLQMLVSLNICVCGGGTDRQTLVGEKEAELVPVPMYMYLMHVWVLVEAKKGC